MSCRQVNYANRRKAELIAAMGGRCWGCGATHDLQIDHPNGRDWKPREKSFCHRIIIYWREWLRHEVRLLCATCNEDRRYNGVELPFPGAMLEAEPADPSVPF
jgi:hypothetical protein